MSTYITNENDLKTIANSIRTKAELNDNISLTFPTDFITTINNLDTVTPKKVRIAVGTISYATDSTSKTMTIPACGSPTIWPLGCALIVQRPTSGVNPTKSCITSMISYSCVANSTSDGGYVYGNMNNSSGKATARVITTSFNDTNDENTNSTINDPVTDNSIFKKLDLSGLQNDGSIILDGTNKLGAYYFRGTYLYIVWGL